MHRRALILNVDQSANVFICFDKINHNCYRLRIRDAKWNNSRVSEGMFILFAIQSEPSSNEIINLQDNEFVMEPPSKPDCISYALDGSILIRSWIACSSDPRHVTFDQKVAFSDWYGLVLMNGARVDADTVYAEFLVVNDLDYLKNGTCLFKLKNQRHKPVADKCGFLKKLQIFEDNYPRKKMSDTEIAGIVLFVNDSKTVAVCYSEQLETAISVKLSPTCIPSVGKFVTFDFQECGEDVYIPAFDSMKFKDDERVVMENGELRIHTMAACSQNPLHPTFTKKIAFAGSFGYVKVEDQSIAPGSVFHVRLAINSLKQDPNDEKVFKLIQVGNRVSEHRCRSFLDRMTELENRNAAWQEPPSTNNEADAISLTSFSELQSTSHGPTMSSNQKEDQELTVLILHIDQYECIGFETTQLRRVSIDVKSISEKVFTWDTLKFIAGPSKDKKVTAKDRKVEVIRPPGNGVQRTEEGIYKISTHLAFSSNAHHRSHNKSVAVSYQYGYIELPDSNEKFEEQTVYNADITLVQYTNPDRPLFKAISSLKLVSESRLETLVFDAMKKLEDTTLAETRQNGLGASEIPFAPNTYEQRPRKKNQKVEKFDARYDALCYDLTQRSANHHGMVWTKEGDAVFLNPPMIHSDGSAVQLGDWIQVRLEKRNGKLTVAKIVSEMPLVMPMTWENNSVVVEHSINFNHVDLELGDRRYYNHPTLGFVEAEANVFANQANLTKAIFSKLRNPVFLQQGVCYWAVHRILPADTVPTASEDYREKCLHFLKDQQGARQTVQNDQNRTGRESFYPPEGSERSSRRDQEYTSQQHQQQYLPSMSQRSSSRMTEHQCQDTALVTSVTGNEMICYLYDIRAAARLNWRDVSGPAVAVGTVFTCSYVAVDAVDHLYYEVIDVIKVIEGKNNDMLIKDNKCQLLVEVDMSKEEAKFSEWTDIGGSPVMTSKDVTYVILAERVTDPRGNVVKNLDLFRHYNLSPRARDMVAYCEYVVCDVPQCMFDVYNPKNVTQITCYAWQLVHLQGARHVHHRQMENMTRNNLGHMHTAALEQEDDVARQKRIAKENDARRQQGSQYGGSQYGGQNSEYRTATNYAASSHSYRSDRQGDYHRPQMPRDTMSSASSYHSATDRSVRQEPRRHESDRSGAVTPTNEDHKDRKIRELTEMLGLMVRTTSNHVNASRIVLEDENLRKQFESSYFEDFLTFTNSMNEADKMVKDFYARKLHRQ